MTRINLKKRPKSKGLAKLKKQAWKLFSEYIRRKYADHRDMVTCVSCPTTLHWKEMQAAHFIPKSRGLVYYFLEKNVRPACASCNMFKKEMHMINFTITMQQIYGPNIVEELEALSMTPAKYTRTDYEELIEEYEQRLSELERKHVA